MNDLKQQFEELAESTGTMLQPGMSVNTQSPCINCGNGNWESYGKGMICTTKGCNLNIAGYQYSEAKDWNYHIVKLRGVELDSLPEGWIVYDQLDKISEEFLELKRAINYSDNFINKEEIAMEIGDLKAALTTLEEMFGIDIEEANRKHCAKMENRGWKARD